MIGIEIAGMLGYLMWFVVFVFFRPRQGAVHDLAWLKGETMKRCLMKFGIKLFCLTRLAS